MVFAEPAGGFGGWLQQDIESTFVGIGAIKDDTGKIRVEAFDLQTKGPDGQKDDLGVELGRISIEGVEGPAEALIVELLGLDSLLVQKIGEVDVSKSLIDQVETVFPKEQGREEGNDTISMAERGLGGRRQLSIDNVLDLQPVKKGRKKRNGAEVFLAGFGSHRGRRHGHLRRDSLYPVYGIWLPGTRPARSRSRAAQKILIPLRPYVGKVRSR
jgi:hypothetical protein